MKGTRRARSKKFTEVLVKDSDNLTRKQSNFGINAEESGMKNQFLDFRRNLSVKERNAYGFVLKIKLFMYAILKKKNQSLSDSFIADSEENISFTNEPTPVNHNSKIKSQIEEEKKRTETQTTGLNSYSIQLTNYDAFV